MDIFQSLNGSLSSLITACLSPTEASLGFSQFSSHSPWGLDNDFSVPLWASILPLSPGASWDSVLDPLPFPLNNHGLSQTLSGLSVSAAPYYAVNPATSLFSSDLSRAPIVTPLGRGISQEPQAQELSFEVSFPSPAHPGLFHLRDVPASHQ